jgi:UDP-4-amino-4,6-dideoxy-N-acetyl-beta-L-altrosamine transaminase/dTDP-4-dehydrorhamnose reductase
MKANKSILITGGSGLLALNWALNIRNKHNVTLLLHRRKISLEGVNVDFLSLNSLDECLFALEKHQPDILIHTAGLTNVEECESNPKLAYAINVDLAKNIAEACSRMRTKLVHISTDHLFHGKNKFTSEDGKATPINTYGKTKLQSEIQVQENCKEALIIRTNFFGWGTKYRQSFSDSIVTKLRNHEKIDLFSDIFFTPILIDELSKSVHKLIDKDCQGIFNIVGNERLSKYEFGIKLANYFDLDTNLINKISFYDKEDLIKRPKDISLSNLKAFKVLNYKIPSIDDQFISLRKIEENNLSSQVKTPIIPYGRHYIDDNDIKEVIDVLRNGMLTQGPKVSEFESKVAKYVGAKYAVAVSSGTAALHLASIAAGLSEGDEVITCTNSFVATSNSVLYVGAKPIFVDIDSKTLNIDIDKIEKIIKDSDSVKAIFPVHFAGLACDMKIIKKLADKYGLIIVEDASHALGAKYNQSSKVGSCQYSNMTCFSFHPVKGIAAGEGGMITTNDRLLYRKLTLLRSHGITKGNFEFPGISYPDKSLINKDEALENGKLKRWYYEMQYLGYNYRITDIQCALASSQMDKIDMFIDERRSMAKFYDQSFERIPNISPLQIHGREQSSHHIYVVSIDFKKIGISRNIFMQKLADQGIGSQVHYIPVVTQPYYTKKGYQIKEYPFTSEYYQKTLSIPLYFGLSRIEQEFIVDSIRTLCLTKTK